MSFDIVAVARKVSTWSSKGVPVAVAATRLYEAYQRMEPTAKASIQADVEAVEASWAAMDDAFDAYNKSNAVSKFSAGLAAIDTITKLTPLVARIAKDGEMLFSADWPVIKPQVDIILSVFKAPSQTGAQQ